MACLSEPGDVRPNRSSLRRFRLLSCADFRPQARLDETRMVIFETSDSLATPSSKRRFPAALRGQRADRPRRPERQPTGPGTLSSADLGVAVQWADSRRARDLLAARATTDRVATEELLRRLREAVPTPSPTRRQAHALVALAGVLLHEATNPAGFADAAVLYEAAFTAHGARVLPEHAQHLFASALIGAGRHAHADALLATWSHADPAQRQVDADRQNPHHRTETPVSPDAWRHAFNHVFAAAGLEPPRHAEATLEGSETAFDRLRAPQVTLVQGPLVTVIMSCYRPGPEIHTAIASIRAQSWQNLELLIIDDGSPAEYDGIFTELAALAVLDPRLRLVRQERNRGTYACRNIALDLARGDFVTMHDSDDWAHPRRLETQAAHLLENPDAPSNSSHALRVTDSLGLLQPRGRDLKLCEPSLMFRRERVLGLVGYFDTVTKGADSEFRRRIQAAFHRPSDLVRPEAPLTLQRYRSATLTGEEIRPFWMHDSRIAYASAYPLWHAAITAGTASPYRSTAVSPRPFPAPRDIVPGERGNEPLQLDVLFVLDLVTRERDRRNFRALELRIRTLAATGQRVGLAHLWGIGPKPLLPVHFDPRLQALVAEGVVQQVLTGTPVMAGRVVLPDPSALQFAASTPLPWLVGNVVAAARVPRALRHRGHVAWRHRDVLERATELFGVAPTWADGRRRR